MCEVAPQSRANTLLLTRACSYPIGPLDALLRFRRFFLFDKGDPALFAAEWGGDGAAWRSRRGGDRCGPQAAAQDGLGSEG